MSETKETQAEQIRRWEKDDAERSRLQAIEDDKNIIPLFTELHASGIRSINVPYDGYGDEGFAREDEIEFLDGPNGEGATLPNPADNLVTAVAEYAFGCVSRAHDGFWNNEGGQGSVTIDLLDAKGKAHVTVDHQDNVIEHVDSAEEYDVGGGD